LADSSRWLRRPVSVLGILMVAATMARSVPAQPSALTDRLRADSLRAHALVVRGIDPRDDDFSDLEPLIQKIGNARVVVLGEATHDEGTTSSAKSRMVRFLHQRMGFDVLAWESGLAQTHQMNTALRDTAVPLARAKSYLMSGAWASQTETIPLFEYVRATWQTDRPLLMTGFDSGRPRMGASAFRAFLTRVTLHTPALALTEAEWKLAEAVTSRAYGFASRASVDASAREKERGILQSLLRRLKMERLTLLRTISATDFAMAERYIADALRWEEVAVHVAPDSRARDRYMADTFLWLAKTLYPNSKIIIWAATAHLIRNSSVIENAVVKNAYAEHWEMGNHISPVLGRDLYTIAFTSHGGERGEQFPAGFGIESQVNAMPPAPAGSLEAAAHLLGQPFLFVDLRSAPKGHWLNGSFLSVALGRAENRAPWSKVLDAFFIIDRVEPYRYPPRVP
jgi:erythromycin esterase